MTEQETMHPFARQIEVIVGPLPESLGGGDEKDGRRFFGDGGNDNLRIKFDINKPNATSTVSIYNLGKDIRNSLHFAKGAQMIVRAGWRTPGMSEIWRGSLTASFSSRQGTDIVTDLIGYAAWYTTMETIISVTYKDRNVKAAVIELAKLMQGVIVHENLIDIDESMQIGSMGLSFAHTARVILDSLSRTYGFSWWVDKGVFQAIMSKNFYTTNEIPLISAKSGYLMRAEPMISSPMPFVMGLSISSLFFPQVNPYTRIRIESVVNPDLNREYTAHTINHNGDTHSNQWHTNIQSWNFDMQESTPPQPLPHATFSDIELIAGTMFGEASNQTKNGRIAVGMTIQKRMECQSSKYGKTWSSICLRDGQFQCWQDKKNELRIINARNANTSLWQECMGIANDIVAGKKFNVGLSGSPTNFFTGPVPYWAKSMTFIGDVGAHHFYHDPKMGPL